MTGFLNQTSLFYSSLLRIQKALTTYKFRRHFRLAGIYARSETFYEMRNQDGSVNKYKPKGKDAKKIEKRRNKVLQTIIQNGYKKFINLFNFPELSG